MGRHGKWVVLAVLIVGIVGPVKAQEADGSWPKRVLLVNDNGVDDIKLQALALAFSKVAETYVVAPKDDQSGTTHILSVSEEGQLAVTEVDWGEGIRAFSVDGYPADAVLVGLFGILRETPPDLVVSGINGGPNLSHDWLGSGTIGAARMAAYVGFPAMAVSGLDDDIPGAVETASEWVVRLAQHEVVRRLKSGEYLTVSMPRVAPAEIEGVRVAKRTPLSLDIRFEIEEQREEGDTIWSLGLTSKTTSLASDTDMALYEAGYISIVPMQADEHNNVLLTQLRQQQVAWPPWPAAPLAR